MSYTWRTASGREYKQESHWRCQDCDAHLEDRLAVEVHEAWHGLRAGADNKTLYQAEETK